MILFLSVIRFGCHARASRGLGTFAVFALVMTMCVVVFAVDADAGTRRKNSSRGRHNAAAIQAQKTRMIRSIQNQIADARKVLSSIESKTAMTQKEAEQAMEKLASIHSEIEAERLDVPKAMKDMRGIEEDILAEQLPESELKVAMANMDRLKEAMHLVIHQMLGLPEHSGATSLNEGLFDLSKLTAEQQKTLDANSEYQSTEQKLASAAARVRQLREKLFAKDSDWIAAKQDVIDASKEALADKRELKSTVVHAAAEKSKLDNARQIEAVARAAIARGEARLRQLGVKSTEVKSTTKK
ncbi:hypothetical protein [Novipirellula rosea]|uniref:Chromosome partition protein Smc n=1 Tax=Novipirellula rosea TaxID=1031540 RepID=A0ABP8NRN4_9BACT